MDCFAWIAAVVRGGSLCRLCESALARMFLFWTLGQWLLTGVEEAYLEIGVIATAFGALGGTLSSVHICILVGFTVRNLSGRGSEASILSEVGHDLVASSIFTRPFHDQAFDGFSNDRFHVEAVPSAGRDGHSVVFASRWIYRRKFALSPARMGNTSSSVGVLENFLSRRMWIWEEYVNQPHPH